MRQIDIIQIEIAQIFYRVDYIKIVIQLTFLIICDLSSVVFMH